ncbi:MAG: MerR family transcriptional regulator [Cyanobacteria bacterium P01_D01_bin.105]
MNDVPIKLYKISAFSRLGQVSIKALRLYDQRGLITPVQVDAETGYRYYSVEQLPRLHKLLALKAMGFSLEQIGQLLSDELSLSQIETMLRLKQTELQTQLMGTQASLAAVQAHIHYLQEQKTMPNYNVVLKSVDTIPHVLSIRETIPAYTAVGALFNEQIAYLSQHNIQPSGYCAAIWHDAEYKEQDVDAEAIFSVPAAIEATARIQVKTMPAIELAACVVHKGTYSTLNQPYAAIMQWIEESAYEICGANREVYLKGGAEQDNPDYVTEIQFPVRKKAA